jgi:hypothetical protein
MRFSQLANWMSVPTDCAQRERRGWLGDAQLGVEGVVHTAFAPAAYAKVPWQDTTRVRLNLPDYLCTDPPAPRRPSFRLLLLLLFALTARNNAGRLAPAPTTNSAKFLDDIADTQQDEWAAHNGSIPEVCPNYGHGSIPPDPPFGIGYAVLWWNQYRYYADEAALAQHYGGVKAFAETLIARAGGGVPGGSKAGVLDRSTSTHGDWVSVANRSAGATTCSGRAALDHHSNATCCRFMECPDAVVNGFYYVTLFRILAAAADVLRHPADAGRYRALAADASASLAAAEYRGAPDRLMGYGYQTDQAMALALGDGPGGVLPSAGDFAAVAAGLAADVGRQTGHLDTGIFGTKVLLPALSSTGHGETAMGVLTQTTPPGWGAWVAEHDATTLFEVRGAAPVQSACHAEPRAAQSHTRSHAESLAAPSRSPSSPGRLRLKTVSAQRCLTNPRPPPNNNASQMWGAFDGSGATGVASHNHVMFATFIPWLYQVGRLV